ncbi:MAG: type I methionyl aminopeptidase [Chloroflexi bacterium]|nr:type I methionyl aminopeptidase [Chloroflexota bacterium]
MAIYIKGPEEIARMREAGRINALVLEAVQRAARPGVMTLDLDRLATRIIRAHGGEPAFLNYPSPTPGVPPYPATLNISLDDELVHGIPSRRRLRAGQIVSIDCGTRYQAYIGDSAITFAVGEVSPEAKRLIEVTREALWRGIAACRAGNRVGDISAAIQTWVESQGFSVVREYVGHGVGRDLHEDPEIRNWGTPGTGPILRPGMTLALEPMVTIGPPLLYVKEDGWTVATVDGGLCAHFEHTVLITEGEPEILTAP